MRGLVSQIIFAAILVGGAMLPAVAGLRSPLAATVDVPSFFDIGHVIDKSGVSPSFADGVDFRSYVDSGPLAFHIFGDAVWWSETTTAANVDLDLGQLYLVHAMAFWNLGSDDPSSVRHLDVYVSSDLTFSSSERVGSFLAGNNAGRTDDHSLVQAFEWSTTAGRYVRLALLDTYSPISAGIGFNEVAFDVSPVPEPSGLMLFAGGFLLLIRRSLVLADRRASTDPGRSHAASRR